MDQFLAPEEPINRTDGKAKVTGAAKYFAEYRVDGLCYCVMVSSIISKGKINSIDITAAKKAPGVLAVYTHENMPTVPSWEAAKNNPATSSGGNKYYPLGNNEIYYNGQPIAFVVADTLERAQYAASLVKANYAKEKSETNLQNNLGKAVLAKRGGEYKRGDAAVLNTAPVQLMETYTIPAEVHNPIELSGITAHWTASDKLLLYAKTQGVKATQRTMAAAFKIDEKNVQVIAEFVGGGFGMALRNWPHEFMAVAIAKQLNKPVKFVLTREQMFTNVGYRPATYQKLGIGATTDGKIQAFYHEAIGETSTYDDFTEGTVNMTRFMYDCANVVTKYQIVALDRGNPIWMRGPGEATGSFALESAMDEMAYKLSIDPLDFRLRNYAEKDPQSGKPYSSKNVKEAYQLGAEKIGWYKRNPKPASMKEGEWLVGYGMGTGVFGAGRSNASAKLILQKDGTLIIQSSITDIGTGTGSVMAQIAHEVLGVPTTNISIELGDSSLPPAPTQGGSGGASSISNAVNAASSSMRKKLAEILIANHASYKNATQEAIQWQQGFAFLANDAASKIALADILALQQLPQLELVEDAKGAGSEQAKYAIYSFSVHFAVVHVHPATGVVKVKRAVTIADAGKIISPKTAASQMIGGVTGGIGMALTEELVIDARTGRIVNKNFGDYHVPVHADVPHIETIFIDKPDYILSPVGAKGMGEIALIGFSAAVANAVYHATGKRIRNLPITPDKILA